MKGLQPNSVIGGKYRLEKPLGSGSMGAVWAARNCLTDRAFAVKFMLPQFARDPLLVHRFLNEAKVCGRLEHPAIVEIYDLGVANELEGAPFLVMELLRGEGLDALLERSPRLDPAQLCPLIVEIASALDQAHQQGVVHRDVKPSNLFLHRERAGNIQPKLLDFGVSKILEGRDGDDDITRVGSVLGSPLYMSPEQARGQSDVDGRSDLWSLGVVLYEALSGELPFPAGNYNAVLAAILTTRHRPLREVAPHVPAALAELVELCLVKERNRRLSSAAQLAERLETLLLDLPASPLSRRSLPSVAPTFDESTEVMSREALLALFPAEDRAPRGEDDPPLSRTSLLRRALLAELGAAVNTSKTDDISEKTLPRLEAAQRKQQLEEQVQSFAQRVSQLPPEPISKGPVASDETPLQTVEQATALREVRAQLKPTAAEVEEPTRVREAAPVAAPTPRSPVAEGAPGRGGRRWLLVVLVVLVLVIVGGLARR
ncbi:MAG: serine/threonine protein kinase [Polyangiaceae bacterium]|jgi:serine/threonine-protein kinase|nr:serine/threonine protein kinase [Polyangiaceae bacterium]